jgi:hypothetical protein
MFQDRNYLNKIVTDLCPLLKLMTNKEDNNDHRGYFPQGHRILEFIR